MLALEIAVIAGLITLNGLLAMAELAIVSSRPIRLRTMAETGVTGARRALALASDPGRFLSTVQIGITLVGILSGAFSGATLGLRLTAWLSGIGFSDAAADLTGVGSVVAAITYASLVIGELVPKQIALHSPERIAVRVARPMTLLAVIASPLVRLLDTSGKIVLRSLGYRTQPKQIVTEDEIRMLVAEAERTGVLEPGEKEMIAGVLRLGDRPVGTIMTPRREVDMIDLSGNPESIRSSIIRSPHSRLPVHEGNPDQIVGIIQAKDLLDASMTGMPFEIRKVIRQAPVIPETVDARDVVAILKNSPVHLGLVHDEYGYFQGLVTTADILESIVGVFQTEAGPAEPAAVLRDDGSYLISGWMPVDEFGDLLGIPMPERPHYHTVAGFILECFGSLPSVGDSVTRHGWRFEVLDLDARRIDKILAKRTVPTRRAVQ